MDLLPSELVIMVLSYMDLKHVAYFSQTSKKNFELVENHWWERIARKTTFNYKFPEIQTSWRKLFASEGKITVLVEIPQTNQQFALLYPPLS